MYFLYILATMHEETMLTERTKSQDASRFERPFVLFIVSMGPSFVCYARARPKASRSVRSKNERGAPGNLVENRSRDVDRASQNAQYRSRDLNRGRQDANSCARGVNRATQGAKSRSTGVYRVSQDAKSCSRIVDRISHGAQSHSRAGSTLS